MIEKAQHCCCRDRQENAKDAEHVPEHDRRGQNQKTRDAERTGEQSRFQNIAIHRLQQQTENHEPKSAHRLYQDEDKSTDRAADNRPEIRDQIRHPDYDRDQTDIGHPGDGHKDRIGRANDQRVQKALHDIVDENIVTANNEIPEKLISRLREHKAEQLLDAIYDSLAVHQQIDCQDHRYDGRRDIFSRAGGKAHDIAGIFLNEIRDGRQ